MNNQTQTRLFHYEQEPPPAVWEDIASSLEHHTYATRLHEFQEAPPASAWKKIEAALKKDKANPAKKISILQWAAAAAIIIAVSGTALLLNYDIEPADSKEAASAEQKNETRPIVPDPIPPTRKSGAAIHVTDPGAISKKFRRTNNNHSIKISSSGKLSKIDDASPVAQNFIHDIKDRISRIDFTAAERYMVYHNDNGTVAKLPKKIFPLVHCREADLTCKKNLQDLQEKVSSASVSADFLGFIELLKHVQENQ